MKPTMQFRWLVRKNATTADAVKEYRETHGTSLMEAKRQMVNERSPVLQQWWETEGYEHEDYIAAGGEWVDIPTEEMPNAKVSGASDD